MSVINPILESYIPLVSFLAKVLGQDTEVVLHDVSDPNESVIAIGNEHVSNRKVGAPMTNMALKFLNDPKYADSPFAYNYKGKSYDGRGTKSSTFFIKDAGKTIGLLCINSDCKRLKEMRSLLDEMIDGGRTEDIVQNGETELFANSVEELAMDSIESTIKSYGVDPERLSAEEKIEIIKQLNDNSVFLLKGTIQKVAKYLKVSEPTIYRYLNKIKTSEERS